MSADRPALPGPGAADPTAARRLGLISRRRPAVPTLPPGPRQPDAALPSRAARPFPAPARRRRSLLFSRPRGKQQRQHTRPRESPLRYARGEGSGPAPIGCLPGRAGSRPPGSQSGGGGAPPPQEAGGQQRPRSRRERRCSGPAPRLRAANGRPWRAREHSAGARPPVPQRSAAPTAAPPPRSARRGGGQAAAPRYPSTRGRQGTGRAARGRRKGAAGN